MIQSKLSTAPTIPSSDYVIIENLLGEAHAALLDSTVSSRTPAEKANLLQNVKRYAEDVLAMDEQNPEAHHMLALSHTLLGESGRAKKHMAVVSETSEPSHTLLLEQAHIDLAARHYNKAESKFLQVLAEDKHNAEAFLGIAILHQKRKDWAGAFLRYHSLMTKGYFNPTVLTGLTAVIPHIVADQWNQEYETTLLTALRCDSVDTQAYSGFANSLLIQKYALDHEESKLDFVQLIEDELLLRVISFRLISTPEVENLVTLLRQTLLIQAASEGDLPDSLQDWVLTIGEAAAHYGYCWPTNDQEDMILSSLASAIQTTARDRASTLDDLIGALMLYGMYEELYSSPMSFQLLKHDLEDWPAGIQPLLAESLYEPSQLHATEVELRQVIHNSSQSDTYFRSVMQVYPKWSQIHSGDVGSAMQTLTAAFGDSLPWNNSRMRPLNVLISACGTGQGALQQAAQYHDINVVGADSRMAHLAFAEYQARNLGIDNVRWVQCSENKLTCLNQRFDIVEWSSLLNHSEDIADTLNYLKKLVSGIGVIKVQVELNQERLEENTLKALTSGNNLAPELPTIRAIRRSMAEDNADSQWQQILQRPEFYFAGGCMEMFFGPEYKAQEAKTLDELISSAGLSIVGIIDWQSSTISHLKNLVTWEASQPLSKEMPKAITIYLKQNQ
ncbi:hypothetical protein BTA51_08170 [Hahella sp. CCB-MM4]|uniref:methyltransferase domain-containing protein n=1 Tax=Hahella sp. (strain CCB-MM4) TaxID=1926491 RepID=UPI000B9A3EF4|nr:methyltransferase domain-containing protein [Hahella sp. CCB-MM4]OZG73776.1 hypothetical protein BTA51_08170 [Hahella sp. CCB-MM4]